MRTSALRGGCISTRLHVKTHIERVEAGGMNFIFVYIYIFEKLSSKILFLPLSLFPGNMLVTMAAILPKTTP